MFIPLQFGVGQSRRDINNHRAPAMRLFSTDLFRNFGIGFVVGALLIAGANAQSWGGQLSSPAQAAQPLQAPAPSAEFVIAPEGNQ
jgi:hypothetical protein